MKGYNDQWIKDRILWAARKNGLPTGITSIYEESKDLPSSLTSRANNAGIPVLAIVGRENRWVILGTDKIIASQDSALIEIRLDDIEKVEWPSEEEAPVKRECDLLLIQDKNGVEHCLWIPPGREFFAIFNILLRLINLRSATDTCG